MQHNTKYLRHRLWHEWKHSVWLLCWNIRPFHSQSRRTISVFLPLCRYIKERLHEPSHRSLSIRRIPNWMYLCQAIMRSLLPFAWLACILHVIYSQTHTHEHCTAMQGFIVLRNLLLVMLQMLLLQPSASISGQQILEEKKTSVYCFHSFTSALII